MHDWAAIQSLIDNQVPESEVLDYKRDCYGNSDKDKRELLKDVSSFANSRGGHIIIGIDENEGVPSEIVGIAAGINLDAEIQRMNQIVNSGLDPAFTSVQFRTVSNQEKTRCLVLDIPRSVGVPHRIAFGKYHKFFVRDSNGKHEATMPELHNIFTLSDHRRRRFRDFVRERIDILCDPYRDTTGIFGEQGLLICHIVPHVCLLTEQQFDIDSLFKDHYQALRSLDSMGISRRYNFDGFMVYSGGDQLIAYTQVFRDGVIEAVMGCIHRETESWGKTIAGTALEREFFQTFPGYLQAYQAINIPPPYIVQLSLVGVSGAYYAYGSDPSGGHEQPRLDRALMILTECVIESVETPADIHKGIKPAFDSLYNALALPECPHFSEDGLWRGG